MEPAKAEVSLHKSPISIGGDVAPVGMIKFLEKLFA